VYHADLELAEGLGRTNTRQGVYAQRRLDSAHRRYLHAVKQLAVVRNLLKEGGGSASRSAGRGHDKRRVRNKAAGQPLNDQDHQSPREDEADSTPGPDAADQTAGRPEGRD